MQIGTTIGSVHFTNKIIKIFLPDQHLHVNDLPFMTDTIWTIEFITYQITSRSFVIADKFMSLLLICETNVSSSLTPAPPDIKLVCLHKC